MNELRKLAAEAERQCAEAFEGFEKICEKNSLRVLGAFRHGKVGEGDFRRTNGYGYGDAGRDKTDAVFAEVFGTEDALVRHNFINGTHAISTAILAVCGEKNGRLVSVAGPVYDTLRSTVKLVDYAEIPLIGGNTIDFPEIRKAAAAKPAAMFIQRSRGYSARAPLAANTISWLCQTIKSISPKTAVIVDNCYGEFCDTHEPSADLLAGSLIKNPGGGIAETGGYICGSRDLIGKCADRLYAPGLGKEAGCSLGQTRQILQGLFFAPEAVKNALKVSAFASALAEKAGYRAYPQGGGEHPDIITSIELGSADKLKRFCAAIQANSPVDSFVTPEPWAMPGYDCDIIMADGAFTQGSSIELSADAPLKKPYSVYLQGGVNYYMAKEAITKAFGAL